MNRRDFIRRFIVSTFLLGTSVAGIAELAALVKTNQTGSHSTPINQSSTTMQQQDATNNSTGVITQQSTGSASVPSGYVYIAQLSTLTGKTYAYFSHPNFGSSIFVNIDGIWKAFSATCTHRPCTVDYQNTMIYCPCHGGTFDPSNGSVTGGPPPSPLPEYAVLVQNGTVYVGTSQVN